MQMNPQEKNMEHAEEAVIEDNSEWLSDDKFYTLTMAEVLERQGLKKEAIKIYQALINKTGHDSMVIEEKLKKLMPDNKVASSNNSLGSNRHDSRKGDFLNWINKLQKGGT